MSDREPKEAGTWAGHQKYECPLCGRDSLDVDALRHHIDQAHPLPPPEDEDGVSADPASPIPGAVADAQTGGEQLPPVEEPPKPRTGGGRKKANEQQHDAGEPAPDPAKE